MSNVKIIGWSGNPLFKEFPPRIERQLATKTEFIRSPFGNIRGASFGRIVVEKLARTIICMTKDVQIVLQQLPAENASINVIATDSNGQPVSVGYGDGWDLKSLDETSLGAPNVFSRLVVNYVRTINLGLLFSLPQGLSISCQSGVATLSWKGNPLEVWDNGTGECGSGFRFEYGVGVAIGETIPTFWREPVSLVLKNVSIAVGDVLMETFTPGPKNFLNTTVDPQTNKVFIPWTENNLGQYALRYGTFRGMEGTFYLDWKEELPVKFEHDAQANRIYLKYGTLIWKQWNLTEDDS